MRAHARSWLTKMAWDEFSVVLKAREFVRKANVTTIPAPLESYVAAVRASVRELADMATDEAGTCFPMADGSYRICINANDRIERRRFTVCHEIAHIVLGLKSDHRTEPWTTGRPLAERLCDLFAAELLLPGKLFEPAAEGAPISLAGIDALSRQFEASVTATGSRYADSVNTPCAFVLSHREESFTPHVRRCSRRRTHSFSRVRTCPQAPCRRVRAQARTRRARRSTLTSGSAIGSAAGRSLKKRVTCRNGIRL